MTKRLGLLIFALIAVMLLSDIALGEESALSAPTIEIPAEAATVVRGEFLIVNVGEVEGEVRQYHAQVLGENGEVLAGSYSLNSGSIYLPSAPLEAGSYTVRACAVDRDGNDGAYSEEIAFTVAAYQGSEPIIVRLNKNTALAREFVSLSFYAPGAQSIQLVCEEEPGLGWGSDTDFWAYSIYLGAPGTYRVSAKAYFADGREVQSDPVELSFQTLGTLGEPEMDLQDGAVTAGEDLTVNYSFTDADVQDGVSIQYCFELYDLENGENSYFTEELAQSGALTIPGDALETGHRYEAHLYTTTESFGYVTSYEQRFIFAAARDDRISLTVDGQSEITVPTHENVSLTIHAPGATAIHLFKGRDGDWDYWGDVNGFGEDIEYDWNHWGAETVALYLRVCFDPDYENENAEWIISDPLIVHVTADNGTLQMPQFTMPGQVNVGSVLDIETTFIDENASWCFADIYARNENGDIDWNSLAHADADEQGHIYLPTGMLQPDQIYLVQVACSGNNYSDSPAVQKWFTTGSEAAGGIQFALSLEEENGIYQADLATPFTALGYVPGAEELRIYVDGNQEDEWGHWWDDAFSVSDFWLGRTGVTTLTLAARMQGQDDWQDIDTVSVEALTPNGSLDLSTLQLNHQYNLGDDLTLNFPADTREFDLHIWKEAWFEGDEWNWDGGWEGNSVTISGDEIPEGIFHLSLNLYVPGYEPGRIDNFVFSVTGSQQDDITLTVGDQMLCGEDFPITLNAPGATAVSWWIPNWSERMYQGSSCEDTEQIRWADDFVIYARAYYGEIDWDSFDWSNWQHNLDWGPISAVHTFTVSAPNGQASQPEVTGVPETVQWNDTLHIAVSAAEHAAWYDVRIRDRYSWDELYFEHLDGPGTVDYNTYDLTPGDYTVEVYVAGEPGYSETGVQIEFSVNGLGQCGAVNAALTADSVPRGQMLEITVPAAENAEWYHARIRDNDWNEYYFVDLGGPGTYLLPTADLPVASDYFVIISTGAPGYYWNDTNVEEVERFTVTEGSAVFEVNRHEALTQEDVHASVYAPGAERIRFSAHYNGENDPGWWDEYGWETESWTDRTHWDWPEENITLRAEAMYDGQWQLIGEQTVTVTANHYYDAEYMRSLAPVVLNHGDDLVIQLPEGVTGVWANIWDDTAGGAWVYFMNWDEGRQSSYNYFDTDNPEGWAAGGEGPEEPCFHGEGGTILVPAQYLKANHTYRLDMDMWGGIGTAHDDVSDVKFSVIGFTEDDITLTINGSQDDQTLRIYDTWKVRVSAPGASAIRYFDGWNWHCFDVREDGLWESDWGDEFDVTRSCYAQACYDPMDWDSFDGNWDSLNWQGLSNIVRLTLYAEGQISAASFTLDQTEVREGEFAVLRLSGMEDGANYHANAYWRDENGEEHWVSDVWYEHEDGVIQMPTAHMGVGEWIIRLDSYGKVGLHHNSFESTITITDGDAGMYLSKSEALVHENVLVSIYAPGAERVRFSNWYWGENEANWWDENGWEDDSWQDWCSWDQMNTVPVRAEAMYNGQWQLIDEINVSVTANTVYDFSAMIPAVVADGQDFVLDLSAASDTRANVYDETEGGPEVYWMNWDRSRQSDYNYYDTDTQAWAVEGDDCLHSDDGNFVLPAQYLKRNHTYRVDIHAGGDDVGFIAYDGSGIRFTVASGEDGNVNLLVNGSSESREVGVNEWYTVTAEAPGAERIRVFDGYNWHEWDGSSFEENWRNGGNENRSIYAQAWYNDDGWDGVSNTIIVSSYSDLQVPVDFSITNENAAVARGDELVLSVTVDMPDAEYSAHLKWMDEYENEQWIDGTYDLDGTTIRIPTDELWEGDFYVRLDVYGKGGYCDNCLDLPFTVTRGEKFFRVDKTNPVVMEKIHITVYDPDASRIRVDGGYGWWDEEGWEGNSGVYDPSWDCSPENDGITVKAEGWHEDDNEWVEIGSAIVVITAPNGMIGEPVIHADEYQDIHRGLYFDVEMPEHAECYEVEVWEYLEDGERVWQLNNERHEGNQGFFIEGSQLELGHTYEVFARALGYGYICHEVSRSVTMAEPQDAPEITVDASTVQQGEFFRVTVNNFDPDTNYHAYYRGDNIDDLLDVWVIYNGAEILVSTSELEADHPYALCVDVFNKPGYAENGTRVDVNVTSISGNSFRLPNGQRLVGYDFTAFAHADGAEQMHIVFEKDGNTTDEWYQDGDTYNQTVWSWTTGDLTAKAYARFGDSWTLIGNQSLQVNSLGQANASELTVSSRILQPGEMPAVSFSWAENADWYLLSMWNDDGEVLCYGLDEAGAYTVDPSWFNPSQTLEAGKAYYMDVSTWQRGYEPVGSNQVTVAVVDASCGELTLNVPAALTEIEEEAFAGTAAKIVRINAAPGLTIGSRAFADSSVIVAVIPEGVNVDGSAFDGCGPVVIVPSMD